MTPNASASFLLAAASLLLAGGVARAQTAGSDTSKAGTMKLVKGDARVIDARGERSLLPGDRLAVADRVVTGADSSATLVLRDGTTLVVGPRSQMQLRDFAFNSTTQEGKLQVSVLEGTMRMITGLIARLNPASVGVNTDTLTMGVRGTDFIVEVEEAR